MKRRMLIIVTILITLCLLLSSKDFIVLQFFIVKAKISYRLGHFDSALKSNQNALSLYPNNPELKELSDKTKLAIEFKDYLEYIRPILIEFRTINVKCSDLSVSETNRTIDDLSAAKELNENLIPRIDQLLKRTTEIKSGDKFINTKDLIMSMSLTREAMVTSAQMLNSLYFSKQQNDQIQQYTSDAYFSNKRFFQAIDEKANELHVPMSEFWSSVN